MPTYKLQIDSVTKQVCAVLKDNTWSIPFDPDNSDYQQYLKWLAESPDNQPEPAENE